MDANDELNLEGDEMTSSTSFNGYVIDGWGWAWIISLFDPNSPLERIIRDIDKAIEARLYYPALLVALTLPDICVGLTLPKSEFVKRTHYVDFIDTYTDPAVLGLDGKSCYQLRGGLVHRADLAGHAHFEGSHVVFTVPETNANIHAVSIVIGDKQAAMFDLNMFCSAMISAAREWYEAHKTDTTVLSNLDNLIRWCPQGITPFLGGAPVVASGA